MGEHAWVPKTIARAIQKEAAEALDPKHPNCEHTVSLCPLCLRWRWESSRQTNPPAPTVHLEAGTMSECRNCAPIFARYPEVADWIAFILGRRHALTVAMLDERVPRRVDGNDVH